MKKMGDVALKYFCQLFLQQPVKLLLSFAFHTICKYRIIFAFLPVLYAFSSASPKPGGFGFRPVLVFTDV
jgi:hypothetical protein